MFKISVITVCRNAESTLAECLSSIAHQTYECFEHILIDGASTDGTMSLVSNSSNQFSKIVSEPDCGIYDAMNKGLKLATGDVVAFLNADDRYLTGDVLSRVADLMQAKQLDVLFGDVSYFRAGNPNRVVRHYRSRSFRPGRLAYGWMPAHPAFFMRRDVYDELGGFKADYRIAGDFELIARAFHNVPLRYDYFPSMLVAMQTGGASTELSLRRLILHNQELLRACHENGISTNIFKILSRYPLKLCEIFGQR